MKPLIINLDLIDISLHNEMRTLLYQAKGFDNCLWIAGEWMKKKLGVIDGFISFCLPGFTEMISKNSISEKYKGWCSIRIPPTFEGQKNNYLEPEEEKFLSLIINEPHNTEHALKISFLDRISTGFVATGFIIQDNLVGFVLLKSKKKLSDIKDIEHYITVFFRRSWEELNLKMLRRNGLLMEFEQNVRCIDNEDKLAGVLLEQAMKLTQAESGAIMEINHLDGKISFKCSSPDEWENRNCDKDNLLLEPFKSTILRIASDKTSEIINDLFANSAFTSDSLISPHITSMMFVPIIFQGVTIGGIGLEHSQKDHFFYPDCFAVGLLAGLAAPYLLTHKNNERRLAEMTILRNLAGVNPADDVSTVFQRAVKGLKCLPGYRGCSFFFEDSGRKPQLIMECYDDKPGMFKKGLLPPRRIPLIKLKWTEELVEIKNDSGELMAKVRVLTRKELEQEPLKQFHFREGSKLAVVHTWPYLDDRDESTDLHQIVIAFDDHLSLSKDAAYFFGSLGIHLHMGIKQSKQWIKIELGRRLDKYLAAPSNYRDFCDNCIRELSEEISGNTHLVYLQRQRISMEQPVVFDLVTHTEKKIDDQLIEITIENHREIWYLISKGKSYRNNSRKMPRFLNPWIGLVKKQVVGILFCPIIDPINRESMGCIFCICDSANKRNPGYTPFHEGIVDVVADKLAIGISHRRREDELSLAFANLGHAVKSPLHGIIGHAEEGVNTLLEEDYESTKRSLEIISELVNEADQQVIISTGTKVVETEVSLGQMLKTLAERFSVLAKKRNVKINCYNSLFNNIPRIRINAAKLECILVVLLDNAIKYSDPSREIRIKAKMLEKGFQIEVSNRGLGILETDKERIYEFWERTSSRPKGRYIRSSGLGLPAARRICDELGIKIHHISEYSGRIDPSEGKNYHTRFFLDFPDNLQITK
ncbi:MAG: GAF domain-containing sensor histidine kinase [Desulfobacterales bacterium]|nr:GAF domain-containing sensor histidine kinase [Desulfobacterales bacterium]